MRLQKLASKNQAYLSNKGQEKGGVVDKTESISGSDLNQLNSEEINKLMSFLKTIQDGACSFAHPGTCLHSASFSTLKTMMCGDPLKSLNVLELDGSSLLLTIALE